VLASAVLAGSVWSAVLLGRDASWLPWLRGLVVALGVLAALALFLRLDQMPSASRRVRKAAAASVVALSLLAGGLGSAAWTVATASQPHSGSIPISGPTASAMGGARGAMGGGMSAAAMGGEGAASSELTALLKSSGTKWSAIVSGATEAASLELATNTSVIALGGWNGGDPYPTLAEFQSMVDRGEIGYFISGGGGMGGGRGGNSEVATWVAANFQAQTVGSSTVYKLSE
jgi:hypothetical protein